MQILIIKPSSLGDIIHSLPVAQSIREQLPDAVISWVVKEQFAEIVRRCPTVNGDVILYKHRPGILGSVQAIGGAASRLREKQFDVVLDFQGLLRTGLMTWTTRSPLKVGSVLSREGSRWFCHRLAAAPPGGAETHAIERLLQFLPVLGLKPELRSPVEIHGEDPAEVDARLADVNPIVMVPNSRGAHKEWKHFPELTCRLLAELPDVHVAWDSHVLWDTPRTSHFDRFINLTSKTSLLQMVEVIRRASLVIANDAGPMHIAAAFGKPTLALFGPTTPDRFGPYPPTVSTNRVVCAPDGDLSQLSVDTVAEATIDLLNSVSPAPVQRRAA